MSVRSSLNYYKSKEKHTVTQQSKLLDYIQKEYDRSIDGASLVEALVVDKYSQKIHGKVAQYGKRSYEIIDLCENIGIVTGKEDSFRFFVK